MSRLKQAVICWLFVYGAPLISTARFGRGLCWLLGPGGLCGQLPFDAIGNGSGNSDATRYEFGGESEQRMVPILRKSEALAVPLDESGNQAHADYRLAFPLGHFRIRADNFQCGVFVREHLSEENGYLSVGVAQDHCELIVPQGAA